MRLRSSRTLAGTAQSCTRGQCILGAKGAASGLAESSGHSCGMTWHDGYLWLLRGARLILRSGSSVRKEKWVVVVVWSNEVGSWEATVGGPERQAQVEKQLHNHLATASNKSSINYSHPYTQYYRLILTTSLLELQVAIFEKRAPVLLCWVTVLSLYLSGKSRRSNRTSLSQNETTWVCPEKMIFPELVLSSLLFDVHLVLHCPLSGDIHCPSTQELLPSDKIRCMCRFLMSATTPVGTSSSMLPHTDRTMLVWE